MNKKQIQNHRPLPEVAIELNKVHRDTRSKLLKLACVYDHVDLVWYLRNCVFGRSALLLLFRLEEFSESVQLLLTEDAISFFFQDDDNEEEEEKKGQQEKFQTQVSHLLHYVTSVCTLRVIRNVIKSIQKCVFINGNTKNNLKSLPYYLMISKERRLDVFCMLKQYCRDPTDAESQQLISGGGSNNNLYWLTKFLLDKVQTIHKDALCVILTHCWLINSCSSSGKILCRYLLRWWWVLSSKLRPQRPKPRPECIVAMLQMARQFIKQLDFPIETLDDFMHYNVIDRKNNEDVKKIQKLQKVVAILKLCCSNNNIWKTENVLERRLLV